MTTTSNNTALASDVAVLTALRALAPESPGSITDALDTADSQATQLQSLLANQSRQVSTSLTDLMPSIVAGHIHDMPVPGTSFWANGRWHIHIRASDPVDFQNFIALHQLKHIIDHPLRRRTTALSDTDWEALANHFAMRVLTLSQRHVVTSGERGVTHE
jgi:hypothetical protein